MYWKHTNESGVQPLKVNLIVYDNDLLQVRSDNVYIPTYTEESLLGYWVEFLSLDIRVLSWNGKIG